MKRGKAGGQYRDPITVERQANTPDAYGNVGGAWETLLTTRADIRETPGKERIQGGALESTRTATIRVRGHSATEAITPADRIIARGETWNIRSGPVLVRHAPEVIEFLCETGVAT